MENETFIKEGKVHFWHELVKLINKSKMLTRENLFEKDMELKSAEKLLVDKETDFFLKNI